MEFFPRAGRFLLAVPVMVTFCLLPLPVRSETGPVPASSPSRASTPKILSFDKNGDGKPDKWAAFVDGVVVEIGYDRNHDGKRDFWEYLNPNGRIARTESDRNFDGQPDLVVHYANGHLAFKVIDDNFDGIPDRIIYFDGDERVGISSEELNRIREKPETALSPEMRPRGKAVSPKESGSPRTTRKITKPATPTAIVTATNTPEYPADKLPTGLTGAPARDDAAFFPLGAEFPFRIPVPGGASALAESRIWNVEREKALFRWPDDGSGFEIQSNPTQGAVRIKYSRRDDPSERVGAEELSRAAGNHARRTFGTLLYVQEQRRPITTSLGPGELTTYAAKIGRQPVKVSLCTVAARDYWIYFLAVSPRETHKVLEDAFVEMLLGARIG